MRTDARPMKVLGALAALATSALFVPGAPNWAADHLDPPGRTDPAVDATPDLPADIADIFAWFTEDSVNLVMTFAGPNNANFAANYDRDVLYKFLISTDAPDTSAEIVIRARFGSGTGLNEYGVRVEGLPGVTGGIIEGPVEQNLEKDGVKVRTGLFDDPFFFDSRGFRESRSMGTIRFENTRDFFAAQNDTALVIQIPRDRFAKATAPLNIWSTTSRYGGQL